MRHLGVALAAAVLVIFGTVASHELPAAASISSLSLTNPCLTVTSPALAYALNGSVYRVDPAGGQTCRLTTSINVKEPRLSPGGKRVAFLSGAGSNGYGAGAVNIVRVAHVGGPASSGLPIRVGPGVHRGLSWSPNGQSLAFTGESGVWVWRVRCQCVRLAISRRAGTSFTSLAWSPDSRHLAIHFLSTTSPTRITLAVADVRTGRHHTVVVRFPAWVNGSRPYEGSYASGIVAWLPNNDLLLRTSGIGIGLTVTGIWLVPSAGGMARLIVGITQSPRRVLKYPLLNATQALVSPDGTKLLLDPGNRFWIGSTTGGSGRQIDLHGDGVLSQFVWVGNRHLAYVTISTIPSLAPQPILVARLFQISLTGRSKLLASVRSRQQDNLSIAPSTRCIGCGGG